VPIRHAIEVCYLDFHYDPHWDLDDHAFAATRIDLSLSRQRASLLLSQYVQLTIQDCARLDEKPRRDHSRSRMMILSSRHLAMVL
jgi:hypothetical protein